MAIGWVDVADNAVKIGLGSVIALMSSYMTLKLTQRHEINKYSADQKTKEIDRKTERYIDFLSGSQSLMQKYLYSSCSAEDDDYINYMRLHNIISITSTPEIRLLAHKTQSKVSEFIIVRKPNEDIDLYRNEARNAVSLLQGIVSDELLREKEKIARQIQPHSWWQSWRKKISDQKPGSIFAKFKK